MGLGRWSTTRHSPRLISWREDIWGPSRSTPLWRLCGLLLNERAKQRQSGQTSVVRGHQERHEARWSQARRQRLPPPYNGVKRECRQAERAALACLTPRVLLRRSASSYRVQGSSVAPCSGSWAPETFPGATSSLPGTWSDCWNEGTRPSERTFARDCRHVRARPGRGVKNTLAGPTRGSAWACGPRRPQRAQEDGDRVGAGMGTAR